MLYYLPLESYASRYTMQWANPTTGWLERNWRAIGLEYKRVDPARTESPGVIKSGCVLDAPRRCLHAMSQTAQIITDMNLDCIGKGDVLYFDDFWHPGIESIAYVGHIQKNKPKMYAFLHAQSVDDFDFTNSMIEWMRPFEKGIARILDGIFVCCPSLAVLVRREIGGCPVHVTGHPFSSEEVMERMPKDTNWQSIHGNERRKTQVVFSSRWDTEKNPGFFLRVAEETIKILPHAKFIVCTSAPKLRSNNPILLRMLDAARVAHPDNIILKENLSKEEYYRILTESKVQMNTADQDWVAITLLESAVAGCYPVYPWFRSFPETLQYRSEYMYTHLDLISAVRTLVPILKDDTLWTNKEIKGREWIYKRFDVSWARQLEIMGLGVPAVPFPELFPDYSAKGDAF